MGWTRKYCYMLFTSNCVSLFSLCCTFQKWAVFLEWFKINSCLLHSLCISIGRQMNHITNSLCPWICPPCPFRPHKGKILILGLLYIIEYNKQETIPSGQSGGWHIALEGKKNELYKITFAICPWGLRTAAGIFHLIGWKWSCRCISWYIIVSVSPQGEPLENSGDTRALQQWGKFRKGTTWETLMNSPWLVMFTFRRAD